MNDDNREQLKDSVKKYITMDDEIRIINKDIKILKEKRKNMEEEILNYMKENKVDQIKLGSGKLQLVTSKVYSTMKKEIIFETLIQKVGESKAEEITDSIIKNRKMNEVIKIKRV